jgi:hypothetical protein
MQKEMLKLSLLTLQRRWGFYYSCCPGQGVFKSAVTLNTFTTYGTGGAAVFRDFQGPYSAPITTAAQDMGFLSLQ